MNRFGALPSALKDTWAGLLQRRLWPIAVVLVVALVAVPLLLTSDPEPVAPAVPDAAAEQAELAAEPLVAVASASERETVRRVLGARKDPFKPTSQPKRRKDRADSGNAKSAGAGAQTSASAGGAASGGAPSSGQAGSGVAAAPLPSTPQPQATPKSPRRPAGSLRVRWGIAGDEQLETLEVQRLDPLPTAEEPLLVYMGLTKDGRSAVFMLDASVTLEGDGRCRPNPADCQTVELAPGETEFIEVSDEQGRTTQYQLDLVRIHGRRAARAPRKDAVAEARATSRALRSLGHSAPAYRFDARTGTLELVKVRD